MLFVVQRYGIEVAGGAEQHCRQFATRLAARGHEVHVLTSRARSAADWADSYPPAQTELDGVTVHRIGVARAKDEAAFDDLTVRQIWGRPPPALAVQERWLREQGPDLDGLVAWLEQEAGGFDVVVFFTYLFTTCWAGLPAVAGRVPTVLHATAHDEPYFWLPVFDTVLRLPSVYAWSTEEERALLARRGAGRRPGTVVGVGVVAAGAGAGAVAAGAGAAGAGAAGAGSGARFRAGVAGLGERPYLLYVGRVTAGKGAPELVDMFTAYKARRGGRLALVLVGEAERGLVGPGPDRGGDVIATGFVDDVTRSDAMAGALALVVPSHFESFSMVLCEAWAQGCPAIVQGASDVLAGQALRSGAGIPYRGRSEWEAAVDLLIDEPALGARLGDAGRRYVAKRYRWDTVLDRYERLLGLAMHVHAGR
ncbi:MAG TPA: glycosyltransferase family 4 protein [Acidimicrobiales bacterium]|nr:glycosyltransferase family 4 protein [Acidimicrobiales bacterium]